MMFAKTERGSLKSTTVSFKAPNKGWVKNQSLLDDVSGAADVLDNIFPTAQGGRLRKGCELHATVAAAVKHLFTWKSGATELMFAATASAIYDITSPADPAVSPAAAVSGLTSGDWSVANFANSAGEFSVLANGSDTVRNFDGTTWTVPAITGVTTSLLSQVWAFKERLWFVEKDTLSVWYLPVNAIAGAATELPLKGIFQLGGSLLFGANWSLDSGDGLDDVCIFVTTEGEVAVYAGTDPSSSTTWGLQGVYRMGRPLSKNGWFKAGGNLAILTEDGIIPISEAISKDRAALQGVAITFPIEDAWQRAIANRESDYPFTVTLWHSQTLLMVGTPAIDEDISVAFVANARTGAWCRYTGWDVQTSVVFDDQLYFGTAAATIYRGEVAGNDAGVAYDGVWVPRFYTGDGSQKFAVHARFRGRASETYNIGFACFADYEIGSIPIVAAAQGSDLNNVWGTGVWGTMTWGGPTQAISAWQGVTGQGSALAPAVRIRSNRTLAPTLEVIALDLVFQQGGLL